MKKIIPIADCLHYKGYRYGGYKNNLYEDYMVGLSQGEVDLVSIRKIFINRVLSFRFTDDFGEILGVNLSRKYLPWHFPWRITLNKYRYRNFFASTNPDIICHTASDGVLASHINREFYWLERAYRAISNRYDPDQFGYIKALPLRSNNSVRYIVLDGNHRIAALHALGKKTVLAEVGNNFFTRTELIKIWPDVLRGIFTFDDANAIFDRYFISCNMPIIENNYQKIIFDEPLISHGIQLVK